MAKTLISEKVKHFIFEHIDSVELLEVLLLFRLHQDKSWNSDSIAHELRSSENSVSTRLDALKRIGVIEVDSHKTGYCRYKREDDETKAILEELAETYKLRKQKVLELIFSPLKKGRHFANAFLVKPLKVEKDQEDGDG